MKTFKQVLNEVACDTSSEYDDMSARELQVAINAAQEMLSMIKSGSKPERWGEGKITLASDYLVSVCTYMKAQPTSDDSEEDIDEPDTAESEYVGHEYTHLQHMYPFIGRVVEEKKASKAEAKYQDKPKNGNRCVNCTMWREPNKCTAVAGTIDRDGWCSWYEGGAYGNKGSRT